MRGFFRGKGVSIVLKNRMCALLAFSAGLMLTGSPALADLPTASELLNRDRLDDLALGESIVIEDFPLADAGRFALDLTRFSVITPGGRIVEGGVGGDVDLPDTGLVLLKGAVVGHDENSSVFIAVGQWGINGLVTLNDEFFSITTGPYDGPIGAHSEVFVTSNFDITATTDSFCHYDPGIARLNPDREGPVEADDQPLFDARGTSCRLASLAIDSDYEFTNRLFGNNTSASADYAQTLLGATSTIYERDVGVSISIGYLRVWGTNTDPYTSGNLDTFLEQVRSEWRTNMTDIDRVIVHGLSGRNLGGGVAYLSVLCSKNLGYGVSSSLNGSFPNPPQDHNNANWDIIVVPHEIGHNFGAQHTHDYNPPIDQCGDGNCAGAYGGTIMSYCHLCSGGIRNIVLHFYPSIAAIMTSRANAAGCIDVVTGSYTTVDDQAYTLTGIPVAIDVLENDAADSCSTPALLGVQSPSVQGGTVSIIDGTPFDSVQYTPPANFSGADSFTYTINDGLTGNVSVEVHSLRNPDSPSEPQPGVQVAYYMLTSPTGMPDFDSMTPYFSDVLPDINYPSTTGNFATSALNQNVGAVFDGYVQVTFPGLYRFEVESSDGAILWIGTDPVVDNSGLHDIQTAWGVVGLLPGLHQVHIEFFEATGNAGLIVRNALDGLTPAVIPASAWFYSTATEEPCVADFNDDGTLDFFDVQNFLAAFAAHTATADINDDGTFDFFDVQNFLALFAAGCP